MRRNWKRLAAAMLACCMTVGALAGCGGKESQGNKETAAASTAAAGAGETAGTGNTAETPAKGAKELTIGIGMTWETLTPFRSNRAWTILYSRMLYDTLAYYTSDGVLNPVVAKSWEVEEDGVTWDVEIYDYVYDSQGNHITASDIVWMMNEQKAQGLKPAFSQMVSAEQTGDYTLKVEMEADVVRAFDNILMHTFVVSKDAYEADADGFTSKVVSTSPYLVTDFVSGSSISFEKRADYWQKEELIPASMANNLDKVTFKYIAEASQQQIALETGEVDAFVVITQSLLSSFGSDYEIAETLSSNGMQLFFSGDESRKISSDPNLCKAIACAIDEQGLIQGVYGGYAQPMHSSFPTGLYGTLDKWQNEEYFSYDVEKAKEYLAQSNYNGETLEILASSSTTNDRICTMIQAYLLEIGVNLKINIVDRALYTSMTYDGSAYDMILLSIGGTDLAAFWKTRYDMTSYEGGDATGRHDQTLTDMVKEASTTKGFTEENIDAINQYVNDNGYAYGICQPEQCDAYNKKIGLTEQVILPMGGIDFIASVYGN